MSAGGAKFLDAADEGGGEVGLVEVFWREAGVPGAGVGVLKNGAGRRSGARDFGIAPLSNSLIRATTLSFVALSGTITAWSETVNSKNWIYENSYLN